MRDTIFNGEYIHVYKQVWHGGDDLKLRVGDWVIVGALDDNDTEADDLVWFDDQLSQLMTEIATARRLLRERMDEQAT